MSLESIYFVTQIIAASAVTASLFYVSREVRHITKALKLATYQSVVESSMEILHSLYTSNETAAFYHRCLFNHGELTAPEKLRWHAIMITTYRHCVIFYIKTGRDRWKMKCGSVTTEQ